MIAIEYCIPKFVGAGSPSIVSPINNLDKPALTQQTTPENISNTGLNLMNFDFYVGEGGFLRWSICVMYFGEPAPTGL
jgi:hypothetical protein